MKIIFIADSHVYYGDQHKRVQVMMDSIHREKPDVVCNLGDIGEVLISKDTTIIQELFSFQPTLFVAGNHDLYTSDRRHAPPQAMDEFLKVVQWGIPLQTYWNDSKTTYEKDDVVFIGTIGFPDFSHPKMIMPTRYYDDGCPTIDATYMNLKGGWLQHTRPLIDAFEKKLKLADAGKHSTVVVITHYPIFESQYRLNPTDDISVYFYCHRIGQLVLQAAQRNPSKQFYCVAGHGHEYNINRWFDMADNVKTFGFVTDYNEQRFEMLEV